MVTVATLLRGGLRDEERPHQPPLGSLSKDARRLQHAGQLAGFCFGLAWRHNCSHGKFGQGCLISGGGGGGGGGAGGIADGDGGLSCVLGWAGCQQ